MLHQHGGGHTSAVERDRIERFLSRMKRMDYLSVDLGGAAQLVESAEERLMRSIIARETHVLRLLCPLTCEHPEI